MNDAASCGNEWVTPFRLLNTLQNLLRFSWIPYFEDHKSEFRLRVKKQICKTLLTMRARIVRYVSVSIVLSVSATHGGWDDGRSNEIYRENNLRFIS